MKRNKPNSSPKIPLINQRGKPILGVRFMQITGISTSPSPPVEKPKSSQAGKLTLDQAVLNFSANSFSSLVKEAGQAPEVRSEVVDAFKSRLQSGDYPSQETIAGLASLIGGSIVQQAKSGFSSQ
jgi:hypothetical protein